MGIRLSRPNTSATPHPSLKQLRQVLRAKVLSISTSTKYVATITTRATTQLTGLSQTKNMPTHIKNSTVSTREATACSEHAHPLAAQQIVDYVMQRLQK